MDGHLIKAQILETCLAQDTLLIDVGMGLHRVGDSLAGTLRTTTFHPEHYNHADGSEAFSGGGAGCRGSRNVPLCGFWNTTWDMVRPSRPCAHWPVVSAVIRTVL